MSIKQFVLRTAGNVALKTKVAAPHLFVGFGAIGLVGAGVLACVQTAKHLDDLVGKHQEDIEKIRKAKDLAKEGEIDVTEDEIKKGTFGVYMRTFYRGIKVYALPIGIGALSIASIAYGHNMLNTRYIASTTAFAALKESYDESRKRAKERFGEEIERNIFDDVVTEEVRKPIIDPSTGEVVAEETAEDLRAKSDAMLKHPFTFIFSSDTSRYWSRFTGDNLRLIRDKEDYWNGVLKWRKYVTINEVLDSLGLDPIEEGFINGWNAKMLDASGRVPVIEFHVVPATADPDDPGYFRGGCPDYYVQMNVQGRISGFKKASDTPKKARVKAFISGAKKNEEESK